MKIYDFLEDIKKRFGDKEALYESSVRTWSTVYRTIAIIRKQWLSQADLGPHKMVNYHPKMIELTMFCSIIFKKTHRKPGGAYVEDAYQYDKM